MSRADGTPRRALLLVNGKARSGGASLDAIRNILREGGLDLVEPENNRDCHETITRHAPSVDLVVLGGGDGTMNAAAPALVETKLPFGILPLGTANDLARSLGLPLEPEAAARVIPTARRRRSISAGSTGITISTSRASASPPTSRAS